MLCFDFHFKLRCSTWQCILESLKWVSGNALSEECFQIFLRPWRDSRPNKQHGRKIVSCTSSQKRLNFICDFWNRSNAPQDKGVTHSYLTQNTGKYGSKSMTFAILPKLLSRWNVQFMIIYCYFLYDIKTYAFVHY